MFGSSTRTAAAPAWGYESLGAGGSAKFAARIVGVKTDCAFGQSEDLRGILNDISKVHQQFLNAGGLGILVGDGMLPHLGPEQIIETYYAFPLLAATVTLDYQFIVNPAYNRDRGPASVIGARVHAEF
jgi:hypothetical protein